jgi:polyvinyl alcohol dehydrogenase (cytochrome)
VAVEIKTGRVVWAKQTFPSDAYNSSCGTDRQNCPDEDGPDYDFGSSAILTQLPGGRDILLAGQKSGMVYALDPEKKGGIVWQARIASPGPNIASSVGVLWGMATDGQKVYAATASSGRSRPTDPQDTRRYVLDPKKGGGMTALRISDGSQAWYAPPIVCAEAAPSGCSPTQSAAVTAMPGVVFSGSNDVFVNSGYSRFGGISGNVLLAFAP